LNDPDVTLELRLEDGRTVFEPGGRVTGVAAWSARRAPPGVELRLSWAVRGPGGRDLKIAETIPFRQPLASERRPLSLTLPLGPYSFRGSLISLEWVLELVALPGEEKVGVALTVAPGQQTIDLRRASARHR
jgi:hypothetical protein